jgi:hypothetical protein
MNLIALLKKRLRIFFCSYLIIKIRLHRHVLKILKTILNRLFNQNYGCRQNANDTI